MVKSLLLDNSINKLLDNYKSTLLGSTYITGAEGIITSASYAVFNSSMVRVNKGLALTPDTANDFSIKFSNAPAGNYLVTYSGRLRVVNGSSSTRAMYSIFDGTNYGSESFVYGVGESEDDLSSISAHFRYTSQGNRVFSLVGKRTVGDGSARASDGSAACELIVLYFPLN